MIKKIGKLLKASIIGAIWTSFFVLSVRCLLLWIWQFDLLSKKQWDLVSRYWNSNGVIVGVSDYMFFTTLFLSLIIWIWGWRRLMRVNYLDILIWPLRYMNDRQLRKYESKSSHIVIKNISVGEKLTVEDVIKERMKAEEAPKGEKVAQDLRKKISEKIIQRKEE